MTPEGYKQTVQWAPYVLRCLRCNHLVMELDVEIHDKKYHNWEKNTHQNLHTQIGEDGHYDPQK